MSLFEWVAVVVILASVPAYVLIAQTSYSPRFLNRLIPATVFDGLCLVGWRKAVEPAFWPKAPHKPVDGFTGGGAAKLFHRSLKVQLDFQYDYAIRVGLDTDAMGWTRWSPPN